MRYHPVSTNAKNSEAIKAIAKTTTVVRITSCRDGHVTLSTSALTSPIKEKNLFSPNIL